MRLGWWMVSVAAVVVSHALSASAQMMGPMGHPEGGGMGMMGGGMGPGGGPAGRESSHEGPLISIMLEHKLEIGLTLEQ